jgi:uncharacterized protein
MQKKFLFFLLFIQSLVFAQDIPKPQSPPRMLNDYVGGLLSNAEAEQLEQKLRGYRDSTSTEIAVVIVKSVQPYDISEYAFKLGKQWGVGSKKNNGVVLLWAPGDRKIFIATGYGLEGAIPDAYAKRIVEQVIKPNFRELRYYQGLDQATTALIKYAKGEYKERPKNNGGEEGDALWGIIVILLIIIFVIIIIRKNRGGGSNNHSGGGWIPYTTYTGWGSSSGGWSSGGGDSGGGGFDFGGFGGGDFGGGGAGGDY